jgi:glycosyltransferase involved in cell wall biosynthesis
LSFLPDVEIKVIYNALFPEYVPKQLTVKQNEITFASNWYKGLERVLNIVKELNKTHAIKLNLLKPNYCNWDRDFSNEYPFVNVIGNVKDKVVYSRIIARSICILTTSYPETFGCVFAESLHIGTPVIADKSVDAGFHEFINDNYKVDFNNLDQVLKKILEIKDDIVRLPDEFYEKQIIEQWKNLITLIK